MGNTGQWTEMKLPTVGENCRTLLESNCLGDLQWRGPGDESTSISSVMEDYDMVEKQKCLDGNTNVGFTTEW